MTDVLRLEDLTENGTVSAAGAEVLRAIGAGVGSFLVYALPRNAGKSTVANAVLAEAPAGTPRHEFFGTEAEAATLLAQPGSGYLVVAEMGHRGRPGYLAEEEIVRAFRVAAGGYALASSLHADSVDHVFEVVSHNGVDVPTAAAAVRYLIKVRVFGDDPFAPDARRIVEDIHEVTGPGTTRLLYEAEEQDEP